jgi:hypothetical protein
LTCDGSDKHFLKSFFPSGFREGLSRQFLPKLLAVKTGFLRNGLVRNGTKKNVIVGNMIGNQENELE